MPDDQQFAGLYRGFISLLSDWESFQISSRLHSGRKELIRQTGRHIAGDAPLGYRMAGNRYASGHGSMTPCPEELPVVQIIFILRYRGYSASAIAECSFHFLKVTVCLPFGGQAVFLVGIGYNELRMFRSLWVLIDFNFWNLRKKRE